MNLSLRQLFGGWLVRLLALIVSLALMAADPPPAPAPSLASATVYLPLISVFQPTQQINVPYLSDADIIRSRFPDMAVFWFGRVTPSENYTDVRIASNQEVLWVHLSVFDRRLWFDASSTPGDLANWDAASLYLDLTPAGGSQPGPQSYHFLAQFTPFSEAGQRTRYQQAYRGVGGRWQPASLAFSTISGWRGDAANNDQDDRGWTMTFIIPFTSLGFSPDSPPPPASLWRLGLQVIDRDAASGPLIRAHSWPEGFSADRPASWGTARFGLPAYTPAPSTPGGVVQIRQGLNGAVVQDASVGGYAVCGEGTDFFSEWGDKTERFYNPNGADYNVQNQADVADWPCFSKVYLRFPLGALPPGKVIRSAKLYLRQFGQAGAPGQAMASNIQVSVVGSDWNDLTLTWNNAPLAEENVSQAKVNPLASFPGWPGALREWDLSYAVAKAYLAGATQLNLALYSADGAYHSGKYFVSSDVEDWNAIARPTLEITWGNP